MHSLVRADWYIKADDDIFFRVDRLLDELRRIMADWKEKGGIAMYMGCMKKGKGWGRVDCPALVCLALVSIGLRLCFPPPPVFQVISSKTPR